ncbi:hypothetical protein [Streptomyces poonensis]|nr:hypothetical protein [Streptomyces poonensis]
MSRAAMALSAAALACTAACGGGGGGGGAGEEKAGGKTSASAAPGLGKAKDKAPQAPLTAAQLDEAALASGDVPDYKVTKTSEADMPAGSVPAEPAACQPIADMFFFTSTPGAESRTGRTLAAESGLDATVTSLALLAHERSDAEKVIADLRTASDKCTAYKHTDYRYSGVEALPIPEYGDEAVSYRLKGTIEDTTLTMTFTIVRSDSTLAAFYAMKALGGDEVEVPAEVIKAQLAKLEKVRKKSGV